MRRSGFELAGTNDEDEYWYVPGELLVHADDSDEATSALAAHDFHPSGRRAGPSVVFTAGAKAPAVPTLLGEPMRRTDGSELRVGPHYLFATCQRVPKCADHARATMQDMPPLPDMLAGSADYDDDTITIGIVDTGVVMRDDRHNGEAHPWIASRLVDSADQIDILRQDEHGLLETAGAHGTFVTGIVAREMWTARIRMIAALEGGLSNEEAVAGAIETLVADGIKLINLSFAGDTASAGAARPVLLDQVLSALPDDVVLVAAAGNSGDARKAWPAAFERVIAVGSVESWPSGGPRRASYSNYGEWVDAYALGSHVLGPHCWYREPGHSGVCELERCWHGEGFRDPQHYQGWARWSGTSFAAATVTGSIARTALMHGLSVTAAARAVLATAAPVRVSGPDCDHVYERPFVESWPKFPSGHRARRTTSTGDIG